MKITPTKIPGLVVVEPHVFRDARGTFFESWNAERFAEAGIPERFAQDNVSVSRRGVLRGLHWQWPNPQAKLVQVLRGEAYDVAVDIRLGSPTFGQWVGVRLSAENRRQVYIPAGFAHGFQVLEDDTIFAYKCSAVYRRDAEGAMAWDDPTLAIDWPIVPPILSEVDTRAPRLESIAAERQPRMEEALR